jgi:hypothetical protein
MVAEGAVAVNTDGPGTALPPGVLACNPCLAWAAGLASASVPASVSRAAAKLLQRRISHPAQIPPAVR